MSSKVWIILSDDQGTTKSVRKELAYEYNVETSSPTDYSFPIGIVFDHGDGSGIHRSDSPYVSIAADPIVGAVQTGNLVGRLLTLVDATFTDLEQRKAFKDMVSQTVYRWNSDNEDRVVQCYGAVSK